MKFRVEEVALEMVEGLQGILECVRVRDRDLEDQMRRAAQSVALNISEANRREGKDRLARFRIAAGSAAETRTALRIAKSWRYVDGRRAGEIDALLDRVLAMLWRLTHPRG